MNTPTTLYDKIQKSKKCKKCRYCISRDFGGIKKYCCMKQSLKNWAMNWTVKQCNYYKRRETICEDEPHAEKTETSEELR